MGKQVKDNISWQVFDPQAHHILLSTLRLLALSVSTLTVLLLVREASADADAEAAGQTMEAVEQALRSSLRQSDAVLHGGPGCSAALLIGADANGACAVVRRLHRALSEGAGLAVALSLGWASTDRSEHEAETLVALALAGRRPFLPVADERLFVAREARHGQARADARLGQVFDAQVLSGAVPRTRARKKVRMVPGVEQPERPMAMQARARALELGVPYLSPPQHIPSSVRKLVPPEVMRQYRCLPVGRNRNALTVALADPTDTRALLCLEEMTGLTIFPVMTDPEVLEHLAQARQPRHAAQELPQT